MKQCSVIVCSAQAKLIEASTLMIQLDDSASASHILTPLHWMPFLRQTSQIYPIALALVQAPSYTRTGLHILHTPLSSPTSKTARLNITYEFESSDEEDNLVYKYNFFQTKEFLSHSTINSK